MNSTQCPCSQRVNKRLSNRLHLFCIANSNKNAFGIDLILFIECCRQAQTKYKFVEEIVNLVIYLYI
jgi:hypothetical protein